MGVKSHTVAVTVTRQNRPRKSVQPPEVELVPAPTGGKEGNVSGVPHQAMPLRQHLHVRVPSVLYVAALDDKMTNLSLGN